MPINRPQLVNDETYHIVLRGVGDFLIFKDENLSPKLVAEKLEIESPEFVTESFDNL